MTRDVDTLFSMHAAILACVIVSATMHMMVSATMRAAILACVIVSATLLARSSSLWEGNSVEGPEDLNISSSLFPASLQACSRSQHTTRRQLRTHVQPKWGQCAGELGGVRLLGS